MTKDNNHKVKKLTGHDTVFRIHLIGELNIQKINPSTKKIPTRLTIESGEFNISILIQI